MQRPSFSIYDASAGSGKTYTLVKEYLKIILTAKANDAYRNILAITFTNKAVHEMKGRIVENLSEFAKQQPSEKAMKLMLDLSKETALSSQEIHSKSKQIIRHIIHNYASFDISTIDKFTHKVIRAFAHDLKLPMVFEVTLDTENLLAEAVDAIIAKAGEDPTLTKLLIDFTMEKTDDDKSWDVTREIMDTGKLILNENNREEITHFKEKTIEEFIGIKEKLNEASILLEEENKTRAIALMDLINRDGIDRKSFSGGYFPAHIDKLILGDFNPKNKTYRDFEDIKINKAAPDRAIIENIVPQLIGGLAFIYDNYEKRDFYKAFLKNITPLSLLNTLSKEFNAIQEEQNVLSIAEFNAIIHREIQGQPAPFIYERLGERYRHFFIDEFQDTSEMQWQNLIPLIDNATSSEIGGEKGTLMIVGDPKQSIYRWRGGKAEQFIELSKGNNPFNNPDYRVEHLDRNFRSYSQVIEFNNDFFKFLSAEFDNEGYRDLYENRSHQLTNERNGGYVNISFLSNQAEDDEEEAKDHSEQFVAATIKAIYEARSLGFEYQDIAVLTRKREQGIAVATGLAEKQIPLLSSETLMLQHATDVRFVIDMLQYLRNNSNLEAKANVLYYLAQFQYLPVHDFIAEGMFQPNEDFFEEWLRRNNVVLSFDSLRKKSLYEATELIISKCVKNNRNNAYLQYFLDIVLERDVRNQSGIADFLRYWEKNSAKFSIPSPEGKNAVKIMTIHKSKGLEFPVVIMPFAEEDYSRKPKEKLWLNAEETIVGLPKALIDNSSAIENFGEAATLIYQQKKQEELLDNVNVLYVALTRAEEQLYIISGLTLDKNGEARKNNMASFFIRFLQSRNLFDANRSTYEFGKPNKLSRRTIFTDNAKIIETVLDSLDPRNIKIAQKESLMWGTHQQEAIEYGNVIHEILSMIKSRSDIDLALIKAIENGLIATDESETVKRTINEITNHPELTVFFDDGNQILNEQAIIRTDGNVVKPDRMVVRTGTELLLLDYKTGAHQSKYVSQLDNYQQAIEKMGYRVTKKTLVYIGEQINIVNL